MSITSHLLSKQNSQQPKQFRGGEKKVMKKSLSLLVAIAMVFSMFATLVSAAETKSAGEQLEAYGIIKGTSNGLDEKEEWKRQDVTVLISRLLNKEDEAKATANTHGFTDVDSKFYNGFISWAKANKYFLGQSDTVFGVNKSITNQEFAQVLLRVLGLNDVAYEDVFEKAVELKLVSADLKAKDNAIRGDIYTTLVAALDYKIDGKKLGTILGLKGYEIVDLAVVKASAPNQKQVKVEFNNDLGALTAANFLVKRADNDSVQIIQNVSVAGNIATINIIDVFAADKDYVVTVTNAVDKEATSTLATATAEFKYVKAAPASIEFASTTVKHGDTVNVLIKDADGNDITPNYASTEISALSSSPSVVSVNSSTGVITAETFTNADVNDAHAVVSAKIIGTEITTGDKIIYVKRSLNTASGIGAVKVMDGTSVISSEPDLYVFKGTVAAKVNAEFKDVNGDPITSTSVDYAGLKANYKSLNPTVLVVDDKDGTISPIAVGSATVVINATLGGKTVTKSVVVTVKDNAKNASLTVDKTTANVVLNSNIGNAVKVTLKDQYGNKATTSGDLTITSSKAGVVDVVTSQAYSNGEATIEIPFVNALKGTTVLTIKESTNANLVATVVVNVVEKGTFVGYAVEVESTTLDRNTDNSDAKRKGPQFVTVKVYEKDSNGNYIARLDGTSTPIATVTDASPAPVTGEDGSAVTVAGLTVTSNKVGTEVITVKVKDIVVGTYTMTVVNSTADILSKVTQNVNGITVTTADSLSAKLFTNANAAFTAYDQYGTKLTSIDPTTVSVYSGNTSIVAPTSGTGATTTIAGTGTVLLTVVINGQVFTINVVVTTP